MTPTTSLLDRANLDRDSVRHQIVRGLSGADDGELFLEYSQSEALAWDDGRLKSASFDTSQGFGLRAVVGELQGYAHAADLSEPALIEILTRPKNALAKQYQRLMEMEGVKLRFQDEALHSIAKKAILRRTGARGLRSIMEAILLDTMYELPTLTGVQEVVITADVVEGRARPLYTYSDKGMQQQSAS